ALLAVRALPHAVASVVPEPRRISRRTEDEAICGVLALLTVVVDLSHQCGVRLHGSPEGTERANRPLLAAGWRPGNWLNLGTPHLNEIVPSEVQSEEVAPSSAAILAAVPRGDNRSRRAKGVDRRSVRKWVLLLGASVGQDARA